MLVDVLGLPIVFDLLAEEEIEVEQEEVTIAAFSDQTLAVPHQERVLQNHLKTGSSKSCTYQEYYGEGMRWELEEYWIHYGSRVLEGTQDFALAGAGNSRQTHRDHKRVIQESIPLQTRRYLAMVR